MSNVQQRSFTHQLLNRLENKGYTKKRYDCDKPYYKISNGNHHIFIQYYDDGESEYGMLTTANASRYYDKYSERSISIIDTWEYMRKSNIKKKYSTKNKNIDEIVNMIEIILS